MILKRNFENTSEMCMITVPEPNREEGIRHVDLGNYFSDSEGNKCLVTTKENAELYSRYVKVPIYVMKEKKNSKIL